MEAGSSTFNLARYLLRNSGAVDVVVLNPANLRIIWDSQKKNDKADAMKMLRDYELNEPEYPHRVIKKRVRKERV